MTSSHEAREAHEARAAEQLRGLDTIYTYEILRSAGYTRNKAREIAQEASR